MLSSNITNVTDSTFETDKEREIREERHYINVINKYSNIPRRIASTGKFIVDDIEKIRLFDIENNIVIPGNNDIISANADIANDNSTIDDVDNHSSMIEEDNNLSNDSTNG